MSTKKKRNQIAQDNDKMALVRRIETLEAEISRLHLHNAILERDMNKAQSLANERAGITKSLTGNNDFLRGENRRLERRLMDEQRECAEIYKRMVWIITHPLRWIVSPPTLPAEARHVVPLQPFPMIISGGDRP